MTWDLPYTRLDALVCETTGLTPETVEALLARLDPPVPVRHVRAWTDAKGHQHTGWHHRSPEGETP